MKYHGIQRIIDSPIYVKLKKHFCPECNTLLRTVKMAEIISADSPEALKYNFRMGNTYMVGNIKVIWTEFRCPNCCKQISISKMKEYEKEYRL